MANWLSDRMREHHERCKTDEYMVYHWYYKGRAQGWNPKSLRWGGIGICPYANLEDIKLRYDIELWEFLEGLRRNKRFMLMMIERFTLSNQIGLKIVDSGLTRQEALDIENFLRPDGYTKYKDQRIWNTKKGGED
jgi:hypothetical protein